MTRYLFVGALALATLGPAVAADLPQPMPPPPPQAPAAYMPAMAPVYNWGGIYFGANGGYGFGSSNWLAPGAPPTTLTGHFNASGFLVGPTLGINVQADALVFSVEGDFDGSWIKGSTDICIPPVACETQNNWLATARGRLGYAAADRVLIYGTAGGAFGNISANTSGTAFQQEIKAGWTAGGGVEAAFSDHLTARVEYLFVDMQDANLTGVTITPLTVKLENLSIVRLGIDYKFR